MMGNTGNMDPSAILPVVFLSSHPCLLFSHLCLPREAKSHSRAKEDLTLLSGFIAENTEQTPAPAPSRVMWKGFVLFCIEMLLLSSRCILLPSSDPLEHCRRDTKGVIQQSL